MSLIACKIHGIEDNVRAFFLAGRADLVVACADCKIHVVACDCEHTAQIVNFSRAVIDCRRTVVNFVYANEIFGVQFDCFCVDDEACVFVELSHDGEVLVGRGKRRVDRVSVIISVRRSECDDAVFVRYVVIATAEPTQIAVLCISCSCESTAENLFDFFKRLARVSSACISVDAHDAEIDSEDAFRLAVSLLGCGACGIDDDLCGIDDCRRAFDEHRIFEFNAVFYEFRIFKLDDVTARIDKRFACGNGCGPRDIVEFAFILARNFKLG